MKMKINDLYKLLIPLFIAVFAIPAFSQGSGQPDMMKYYVAILVFLLIIAVILLIIAGYLLFIIRRILAPEAKAAAQKLGIAAEEKESIWATWKRKMTRMAPVEKEADIMLDHDYDGIKELDNHLPPWWKYLFYFTIAFGVVYLLVYHVFQFEWAPLQEEAYRREMALAEEQMSELAIANVELTDEDEALENGENLFVANCAACHLADGGGSIGPNLTDNYWIHGGEVQDVYNTIKDGVPGKGMISWESRLSPSDMRDVASFILLKLVGTDPAQGKAPEGELFLPEGDDISSDSVKQAAGTDDQVAELMK